jgi:hypothetical protein
MDLRAKQEDLANLQKLKVAARRCVPNARLRTCESRGRLRQVDAPRAGVWRASVLTDSRCERRGDGAFSAGHGQQDGDPQPELSWCEPLTF